jgi:thiosulfate reductase cytochrome b subunit
MVHPRLYWGEAGNDLTPPLLELPISRNYQHGGWTTPTPLLDGPGAPVSARRTFHIFNQNVGQACFLAAWGLVAAGLAVLAGHRRTLPSSFPRRARALSVAALWRDLREHLRGFVPLPTGNPDYGPLQRTSYVVVVFWCRRSWSDGLTMSPAVAAAPGAAHLSGGHQSARTLPFAFAVLMLFFVAHVVMVIR